MEEVTSYFDSGYPVDVIYLDFQKAFDKVPHQRLLLKLAAHGISGNVLKWIENWLQDRKQRVVLNGQLSEWCQVLSGVPQTVVSGRECPLCRQRHLSNILKYFLGYRSRTRTLTLNPKP